MFIRSGLGWSQTELAEAAGIQRSLLNGYESGKKTLHRPRLEYLLSFMGLTAEAIDRTLTCLEANRSASRGLRDAAGQLSPTQRSIDAVAVKAGRLMEDFARQTISLMTFEGDRLQARQQAEMLWSRLSRRKVDERIALVEDSQKFRSWALVERVAAESIAVAPKSPADALKLAQLAVRIAELCPGEDWLRSRAQGYAWFHVSNAQKASSNFEDAEAAMSLARRLWEAGAQNDPGLFNEAIALALEAKVHQALRHFALALRRIDEALSVDTENLRGRLLLNKAQILDALGDTSSASEVLSLAVSYINEQRDPRTALGVRFQLLLNLCLEDRPHEAATGLPIVRTLAERLGQQLDLARVVWLEGKIAAGRNATKEAEAAFEQARRQFASFEPPIICDFALVSLDLALLLLREKRSSELRALAQELVMLFSRQGGQEEVLAALRLYYETAKREAVTLELTKRVIRFIHRVQHDPDFTFAEAQRNE
ncbi:MAG TPA: helix-turn-helix transcriptional regulator [Thermoanaerobaculia bacterium]|nr:helix-turn-helix transcriptional regulator [Thermoanaerobaculia bacterium]